MTEFNGDLERIFGPPGTGKTTTLARLVRDLITEYGPESIQVSSFAVTAAQEIGSRFGGDGVQPFARSIGTLHSHAFRALGHGAVALDPKVVSSWNSDYPEWKITPDNRRTGDSGGGPAGARASEAHLAVSGDDLIAHLDKLRALRVPHEDWPANIRKFSERWSDWKRDSGAVDYTDMIAIALERALDGEPAPGKPRFMIADEAQDQTPLETALVVAWGEQAERLYVGLDDDQAINRWRGGDPEPLLGLTPGPLGQVADRVLEQSYRVPGSVHAASQRWVDRLSMRRAKEYFPRVEADGVPTEGGAYKVPESLRDKRLLNRIECDLDEDPNQTVMVLASCNYMLEPLIAGLRERGVPFHNPFRPAEASWNPLGRAAAGISTSERVFRYLIMDESLEDRGGRFWTGEDVSYWMELIKLDKAGMIRGAKKMASLFDSDAEVPPESIRALFADEKTFEWASTPSIDWLSKSLLKAKEAVASYPIAVARMHGPAAIAQKPRLIIGTIHSVKGGAADVVYLAPDISPAGQKSAASGVEGRDELIRLIYVGMTRAYRELRLLNPAGQFFISRDEILPTHLEVLPQ